METIVDKFILQLEAQLTERRVAITLTPEARTWLAKKGFDPIMGARPLARVIQTEVRDPLTDEILFGQLEQGGTVTIGSRARSSPSPSRPRPPRPHPASSLRRIAGAQPSHSMFGGRGVAQSGHRPSRRSAAAAP